MTGGKAPKRKASKEERMRRSALQIASVIRPLLPETMGFFLLIYEWDHSWSTYVSNAPSRKSLLGTLAWCMSQLDTQARA